MQNKITQVFILSAGLGTRLRPLTESTPKVMLEITAGLSLLEHSIVRFREQGIRRFVLNLHFFPEKITSYFLLVFKRKFSALSIIKSTLLSSNDP